jgi:hypothetical protein
MEYHRNFFITLYTIFFTLMLLQIWIEVTLLGDKVYKYLLLK